jgi:uncharacterized protein GlcG (DUF336 family)
MTDLIKKSSISYELAQNLVSAAVAKATELGVSENVVILDDGGDCARAALVLVPGAL